MSLMQELCKLTVFLQALSNTVVHERKPYTLEKGLHILRRISITQLASNIKYFANETFSPTIYIRWVFMVTAEKQMKFSLAPACLVAD